ncbi:MAG: hydrolase 1, exosortase A system-associated [Alphaproteobacteria bacterium]
MSAAEAAFAFPCQGADLVGILHPAAPSSTVGVVLVVGGPQYRVGSHRQFVTIARAMAGAGFPVLRFDYRGMGDSEGDFVGFEGIGADIRAAIDALVARAPGVERVALWGLCDAASAIMIYAHTDPRVAGIVLVNPWVRTAEGLAKARLRHYYAGRLFNRALWRKLATGKLDMAGALRPFGASVAAAIGRSTAGSATGADPLPMRMADGLCRFDGRALLILSGNDLTAREFEDAAKGPAWRGLLDAPRVTSVRLPGADHTFSQVQWRNQVIDCTTAWLTEMNRRSG